MVKFTNKIEAIKFLRNLPTLVVEGAQLRDEPSFNTTTTKTVYGATGIKPGIGLKEAKDFVEAVMEFAELLSKKVCYACKREIKHEGMVNFCPHCGKSYPLNQL